MAFLDKMIDSIFPERKIKEETNLPLIRQSINRSIKFISDFELWRSWPENRDLLRKALKNFRLYPLEVTEAPRLFVHQSPQSEGMYFYLPKDAGRSSASYFLDYLKDKATDLDYKVNHSLYTVIEKPEYLTTIERYYLKPALKYRKEHPYQQLFGNLILETVQSGEEMPYIKIQVNYYADRAYQAPQPFAELLEKLLKV